MKRFEPQDRLPADGAFLRRLNRQDAMTPRPQLQFVRTIRSLRSFIHADMEFRSRPGGVSTRTQLAMGFDHRGNHDACQIVDLRIGLVHAAFCPLSLVTPGDSSQSYLMHKLDGTHLGVGGSGDSMPPGLPLLDQDTRDGIRAWIDDGALP